MKLEQPCMSESSFLGREKDPITQRKRWAINESFHFTNWMEGNPMDHHNDITTFLFILFPSGPRTQSPEKMGIPLNALDAFSFSSLNAISFMSKKLRSKLGLGK